MPLMKYHCDTDEWKEINVTVQTSIDKFCNKVNIDLGECTCDEESCNVSESIYVASDITRDILQWLEKRESSRD